MIRVRVVSGTASNGLRSGSGESSAGHPRRCPPEPVIVVPGIIESGYEGVHGTRNTESVSRGIDAYNGELG
jgi:hypothetical protein